MPHLFVSLTAHGYGHLAQVAPVLTELAARLPGLRLTLQGDLAPGFVRSRLPAGLRHLREAADLGLIMDGPLVTRWEESLTAYERFVADRQRHLARQREILAADPPDLVLGNVPWVPLAAARSLGIPAVSLSSLNWYDILLASPVGHRLPPAVGDAMITKPGYGSFAEAACNGIPVVFVSRSDWPEEPYLTRWLAARVPLREIGLSEHMAGRVAGPLAEVLAAPPGSPTEPTGVAEAADLIQALLPSLP